MVPSKELVKAVLGSDTIVAVLESPFRANTLRIEDTQYGYYGVNTHTLAHQVKEWAYSHKYVLKSGYINDENALTSRAMLTNMYGLPSVIEYFTIKGEYKEAECIFMAGEEILRRLDEILH